jgi:Membrane bound O-acyl transferase family
MTTVALPKTDNRSGGLTAWVPLFVLPTAAVVLCAGWPRWALMWGLAVAVYLGCKWLTFTEIWPVGRIPTHQITLGRSVGYLLFWPGMNAEAFLRAGRSADSPKPIEWVAAFAKTGLGCALILSAIRILDSYPHVAGWIAMVGIAFVLHFGLFDFLSLCWRQAGVDARPIMDAPIKAASLAEFWGRRWNLAFRDLAHAHVFRPLVSRCGLAGATMTAFVVSGLIHDFVISFPARAGFGRPSVYFTIQGLGFLVERSRVGKRIGLGRGRVGWLFCMLVTAAPLGLLFHLPFVEHIVIPMLSAFRAVEFRLPAIPLGRVIFIGGILHFGILLASAMVPRVLDWKGSLAKLDRLSRELIWVHGAFIVLVIVGFGTLSVCCAGDLTNGTRLARAVCLLIAVFWASRLAVQLFVFDARPYLTSALLRTGYHGLTLVFTYLAFAYSWAAFLS